MTHAHPRPWHRGSVHGTGPRRPFTLMERRLWEAQLAKARHDRLISATTQDVGQALVRMLGRDGRLDPSEAAIAELAHCSESTVRRAKARLLELGLLRWQRRIVCRPGSWRAEQTSNAYELVLLEARPITPRMPAAARGFKRRACDRHPAGETPPPMNYPPLPPHGTPGPLPDRLEAQRALAARCLAIETKAQEARQAKLAAKWRSL